MKEIIALIRPGKARATKQKLADKGFVAYTELRAQGRGKQGGLHYGKNDPGIPFLPKRALTLFVKDEEAALVIAVLTEANRTGEIGDGKIFVLPTEDALRIRTDERNLAALV